MVMVMERDPDTIIKLVQEFKQKRDEYIEAGEKVKRLTGIDMVGLDGIFGAPASVSPLLTGTRPPRFKQAVKMVIEAMPGLTPKQILGEVLKLGVETQSKTPVKMVSIALYEFKKAGEAENRDGGWYRL